MLSSYRIEYGNNHGTNVIIQLNFNAIRCIHILNWDMRIMNSSEHDFCVAVWCIKTKH